MKIKKIVFGLSAFGAVVGSYVLLKDWAGGDRYEGKELLNNKTVIVTGATSGIGKATAEDLARRGGKIILACRDMEKCAAVCQELIAATSNTNLFCRHLDLASIESIKKFAREFNKNEERLDILVNNAGVMKKKRSVTKDGFESHLGVNFLGRFLLTNLLLEKMKSTSSYSRIINLVCIGYNDSRIEFEDFNQEFTFNARKTHKMVSLANILFTMQLADKLKDGNISNIGVYSVNPGLAETNLRHEFGAHKSVFSGFILKPLWITTFKLPREACQTVFHCALSPDLDNDPEHSGNHFRDLREETVDPTLCSEPVRKRLWEIAECWTRLKEPPSSLSSPPPLVPSPSPSTPSSSSQPLPSQALQAS